MRSNYNNPIEQMMRSGQNPQQFVLNYLQQGPMARTPMGENLLNLAQQGRTADIEQIARNICASRGEDFDTAFKAFQQQLGGFRNNK